MKKRVLVISTVGLKYEGITSVIMSYLEAMDLSGLEVYVVGTIEVNEKIKNRIEKLGCELIEMPNRKAKPLSYFIYLSKYIRKKKIDVIHAHGNSGTLAIEMMAALLGGCKKRIAHSHNTCCEQKNADRLLRPIFNQTYTDALACGNEAGKWLYKDRNYHVLANGRNIEKYKFDCIKRKKMREELGIQNELVIGHVGGFVEQKNYKFILEIYRELIRIKPQIKFFMIGDGPLKDEIQKSAVDLNITFTGAIDNISDYISMMDGIVFPSLFEGLPLVVIEWQINGIPCVMSDVITTESIITPTVETESLKSGAEVWANHILRLIDNRDRMSDAKEGYEIISESEFNINKTVKWLKNLYME